MKMSHKANYGASREMWTRLATKPMDIEDALNELKESEAAFKVFYDKDDNMRVIYPMKEESKFGLY